MKALVTGSTGLLGSNLVRLLRAQGHEVKALARSEEKAQRFIGDTGAQIVVGDLSDVQAFAHELDHCDVLFHTAAFFREYYQPGDHWATLKALNVDATIELLTEAEKRGVKKAVHTSSNAVLEHKADGSPADESSGYNVSGEGNLYFKSKILAEKEIFKWLETHEMPVMIILPGWMYGPGDAAPTSAGRIVLSYLNGKLPGSYDGGGSTVDARDVALAMIAAAERGESGERYSVAGELRTLSEINNTLEKVTGIPAPPLKISYPIMLAMAFVVENIARLRGAETLMTTRGIKTLRRKARFSSAKAQRELGITFRPFEETIADQVDWYIKHGYVSAKAKEQMIQSAA